MKAFSKTFEVKTRGKGTYEITDTLEAIVRAGGVTTGTLTVFLRHTSASLIIYENADPTARRDLHAFFERIASEDDDYAHTMEGPDDSTSHLRMALTRTSEVLPIVDGRLALGTWQGVFVFEHRRAPHTREVTVVGIGE